MPIAVDPDKSTNIVSQTINIRIVTGYHIEAHDWFTKYEWCIMGGYNRSLRVLMMFLSHA